MANDLVITTRRLLTGTEGGSIAPGTVVVRNGRITEVRRDVASGSGVVDVGDLVVMPGVIDTHVHVNDPGRAEWEGFGTAGRAAAAGGVTTMVVMPLNCSPVATTVGALEMEAAAARGACAVDYGFWGGVVPGNAVELKKLWEAGVLGFKCFLVHSGIDEFPGTEGAELEKAAGVLAGLKATLLVHAEDPRVIEAAWAGSGLKENPRSYAAYLKSRPPEAEVKAIETMVGLCRKYRGRMHIVHVATGDALPVLSGALREGLPITAETCPHYLTFAAEEIGDGETIYKCAPPIRGKGNREWLWGGLKEGVLDLVDSDHSPCPPEMKLMETGDFAKSWGGISSLQLTLPAVWTGARARGFGLGDVCRWLCRGPAKLAGIESFKGRIAPGYDGDLVVWDPEAEWTVQAAALQHRHAITPYDGRVLAGVVKVTYVRGQRVFGEGEGFLAEATGQWVKRTRV